MIGILHSIILGIVEGITEFLPISSTGHLILTSHILKIANTESLKTFEIVIQLGAILAVVVLYFKDFLDMENLKKLFIAFLPTAILGFTVYSFLKKYLLGNVIVVIFSLLIGGVAMILLENYYTRKNRFKNKNLEYEKGIETKNFKKDFNINDITYQKAFFLGLWQSVALIPGVSRSGATIIGGLLMNLKRETIVKFSFLLAVPVMIAASGYDLLKSYKYLAAADITSIIVGFIISFIFALIFIKWLMTYIQKNSFIVFGWYRIIIAILFFVIFVL